nr:MAG: VP6 [Reoviridae sp.]
MSSFSNLSYIIDKNYNDFGPHASFIAPVGRIEVTILDNLYSISKLIHGRIMSNANISGGFRVYIPKGQLQEMIMAYQSIAGYRFTNEIEPLIASLKALLNSSSSGNEIGLDNRIILQMVATHNGISSKIGEIWEGTVTLRFMSCSGFNKDMTIDGRQQVLNNMLSKFSNLEMQVLIPEFEKSGQLAGIRAPRQVDARDMIADMLFSRKDSSATLHDLFYTMQKQRCVLREFRTDILFCPVERYRELEVGWTFKILADVSTNSNRSRTIIRPLRVEWCDFIVKNISFESHEIQVTGSVGSGVIMIKPLQEIRIAGTSISFAAETSIVFNITLIADIRDVTGTGNSIVALAMRGQLKENDFMANIFYQVINPIIPYLNSLTRRITENETLKLCVAKIGKWIELLVDKLKPGNIYSGWLLTDETAGKERLMYIYMLSIMLPEYLLDPTFTFSGSTGTPPYLHEYGSFVQSLKTLYE